MISQTQIDEVVSKIVEGYQPEKIILFGSYADGTANEDSDLDLLIVKDTDEDTISREMKVSALLDGTGIAYDVFVYNKEEEVEFGEIQHSFFTHILNSGKKIYG